MRDPANRNEEAIKTQFEAIDRGLSYIDRYVNGDVWAVGDRPSIGDCALVPILNIVSFIGSSFGQSDLIAKHEKLGAYWRLAQSDEINAKVISEQLAAIPKA